VYVLFITLEGMQVTPFEKFEPILLKTNNTGPPIREKNWGPFVIEDDQSAAGSNLPEGQAAESRIYFMYSYDPLCVLYWDFNHDGLLKVAYKDPTIEKIPFDTVGSILRGNPSATKRVTHKLFSVNGCRW
jgi:hypothetical protein